MPTEDHETLSTTEELSNTSGAFETSNTRSKKDELLRKMSPEKRALFDRISTLRTRIGPVKFDVVEALREMREDG